MRMDNKRLVRGIVGVVVLLGALAILQMWFDIFKETVFIKTMVTLVIVGGVATFIIAVREDLAGDDQLKKDKYLD
jgi:hypothetical protein